MNTNATNMAFVFIKDRHEMFIFTTNTFTRINVKWKETGYDIRTG